MPLGPVIAASENKKTSNWFDSFQAVTKACKDLSFQII